MPCTLGFSKVSHSLTGIERRQYSGWDTHVGTEMALPCAKCVTLGKFFYSSWSVALFVKLS